jgi:hypothetical protein
LHGWTLEQFEECIYNADHVQVGPGYLDDRPRSNAGVLRSTFPQLAPTVRHLDYGGGNGHISLYMKKSLATLARDSGLNFGSFTNSAHVFFRTVPPRASHLIRAG